MNDPSSAEEQRQAALARYEILDTPKEKAFDEIAELVAAVCEAPIAVVNLISDKRQFFKAEVGLGVRETPLETSFCAHAILEEDFLLVPDATKDTRFNCNPLVTGEANLRFYAGALLKSSDGFPIGTLCVLDTRPRDLTEVQKRTIRVLAKQVMVQLELRVAAKRTAASEARQRAIMDSAQDFAIIASDLAGTILEWSQGAEQVLGWSEAEAVGRNGSFIFTEEDRAAGAPDQEMKTARDQGRAADERWHLRKSGERFWASGEMSPLKDPDGRHVGYVKILRDRTEQHLAGKELEETQQSLRWAQAAGGIGVFHVGPDGVLHTTPELCRLYGVEEHTTVPAQTFEQLIVPEDRHLVSTFQSRTDGTAQLEVEYRIRRANDGALRWIARKGEIQRDEEGKPVGFAGVARDITEERVARDALVRSEERFQTIIETIEAAFAIVQVKFDADDKPVDYRFLEANPAFELQAGVNLRGKWVTEYAPDLERFWFETYGHVARTGEPATFESYAEAFKRWFDVRAVRVGNPEDRQIAIFFNDVTARREAEDRLRESEALARQNIERVQLALGAGAILGTWHWDLPTDQVTVDEAFASAFGLDPEQGQRGMPLAEIVATVHPDDQAGLSDAIQGALGVCGSYTHQYRVRRADGCYYWVEASGRVNVAADGTPLSFPGVLMDIEERRAVEAERDRVAIELRALNETLEQRIAERSAELMKAEEQLRQSQKMEAVGQLTGGIAHDFNNMLTGVIGGLDLIQMHLANGRMDRVKRYIDAANTSAQRAAALTSRLLAFGRRQSLDLKPTDVNVLVSGMEDLLRRTLGEQVALETHFAADAWPASTDPNQLESALLNLCINARDAMPDGGKLTIETANTHLDERYVRDHDGLSVGDYVVVSVSDTGTGMSPQTAEKVFEPFFTTKPVGQGTGLGLSMIYGFARQAGGHVRIYSEIDQGTSVKLYMPRSRSELEVATEDSGSAPKGDGETVLVVEDDPSVRLIVLEVLEELGYEAIEAVDAQAALPVLQSNRRIDLLVTDVGLPGMNGRQLAEVARQSRPDLRVLFITGYAQNAAVRSGFLAKGMEMVTKPFAVDALATKIRDILGS